MKNIIIGMVLAVLLIAIGVGGYIAYNSYANQDNNDSGNYTSSNQNDNEQGDSHSSDSSTDVDVLSEGFSHNFMNSDVRDGFYGLAKGMSRDEIESKFGSSERMILASQFHAEKYGNLAVKYDSDDKAEHIFIAPDNVKKSEFTDFHGIPTLDSPGGMVYDDNPNNSFSVLITTQDGMVTAIENADQIARTDTMDEKTRRSLGGSEDTNANPVTSESEAMAVAQDYLDSQGEGGWVHSASLKGNKWRVNVGMTKEASHAHDILYVFKHNRIVTSEDN
ncbi:hypothetical protein MUA41_00305 [Staphylococcus simulans]|uniref:hypothetical protein n=1 Tax=Staphylococcus simulans TaxID=1286 RepID=UPI0021D24688|nr:hypothetical protein [Staphylococcus simulans]UXR37941.1 hypothetical protein MUA41_00305 [Staphylococcus simulans]